MDSTKPGTLPLLRRVSRQAGLVAAFLLILAGTAFTLLTYYKVHQANQLVIYTQNVITALQDVRELVRQSGSGERGYVFSHDQAFLTEYEQAEHLLPGALASLRTLVAGDAGESSLVNDLTERINQDQQRLARALAQEKPGSGGGPTAQAMIASRLQTDALADAINPTLEYVRQSLQQRITTVERRTVLALPLVGVATMLGVFVIALMLRRMQDEADARSTELAGAGAALQDSEQRFRRVFDESPIGIVLAHQGSLRIVRANPAFCLMLGYAADELAAKTMMDIAHIDDRDMLADAIDQTIGSSRMLETRCVTRTGVIAWAQLRLALLSGSNPNDALLLVLAEDITREKQVEAELRQAQKMEAIGQLTGGIAHDFNNLLGVIIGNAEFLLDAVEHNQANACLAREILTSALSGADLTRRLLAFASRQTLQPRRVDLNAYLPNHIAIVRRLIGETIRVTTRLAPDLWSTRVDASQVGDALLNLAINARDAMPHGGRLTIETANAHLDQDLPDEAGPGDYVVLSVSDTGTGMPAELLDRVLEPFFTTKSPGAGSGLGLSMIYGFAKQSGGHLTIASEPGHGTTVRLYLPRSRSIGMRPTAAVAEAQLPGGNETILLVDDNIEMRSITRRHLVSLGYQVSEAGSGPAALAVLEQDGIFDLLFTDIVMPEGMTGYQLAAVAQQRQPSLKVLFTTGYARALAGSEGVAAHPGAMLRKPYRKQELAVSVRAVLEA